MGLMWKQSIEAVKNCRDSRESWRKIIAALRPSEEKKDVHDKALPYTNLISESYVVPVKSSVTRRPDKY